MSGGIFDLEAEPLAVGTIIAILMLPNVLIQFIFAVKQLNAAPLFSFWTSLLLNAGYGLLFLGEPGFTIAMSCIGIAAFFILIPFDYCCCSASFHGNHLPFREIMSKKLSREEFMKKMCKNRALPPRIRVTVEAYHYVTRVTYSTTRDSNGNVHRTRHTHRERVTTYRNTRELYYKTWEEDGNPIRMREASILHALCKVHYSLDDSAKDALNSLREHMRREGLRRDYYADVSTNFFVDDIDESITGSASEEGSGIMNFYQSGWGRFFWFFFTLLGYQSAYECFWCGEGERMKLKLKKKISCKDKRRCPYGYEDKLAAMTTFRFDGKEDACGIGNWGAQPIFLPDSTLGQSFFTEDSAPVSPQPGQMPPQPGPYPPQPGQYPPQPQPGQYPPQPQPGQYPPGPYPPQQGQYPPGPYPPQPGQYPPGPPQGPYPPQPGQYPPQPQPGQYPPGPYPPQPGQYPPGPPPGAMPPQSGPMPQGPPPSLDK